MKRKLEEMTKMTPLQKARYRIKKSLLEVSKETGISAQCIFNYEHYLRFSRPPHAWILIMYYEKFKIKISLYDFYPKILCTHPEMLKKYKELSKKSKKIIK